MTKLQCKVCGGKLIMSENGNFTECENCGTQYTQETMQKMLVEISGEKVEVEGITTLEGLARNAASFVELGEFGRAKSLYNKMIEESPKDYRGWWGLVLCQTFGLSKFFTGTYSNFKKAIQMADEDARLVITKQYEEAVKAHKQRIRAAISSGKRYCQKNDAEYCISFISGDGEARVKKFCFSYIGHIKEINTSYAINYYDKSGHYFIIIIGSVSDDLKFIETAVRRIYDATQRQADDVLLNIEESFRFDSNSMQPTYYEEERKNGCYIATAVYGSYDCPQVRVLRRYRDHVLAKIICGRLFIRAYYAISPIIVKWFAKTAWFNRFWKNYLDKKVEKLISRGIENTPYVDET